LPPARLRLRWRLSDPRREHGIQFIGTCPKQTLVICFAAPLLDQFPQLRLSDPLIATGSFHEQHDGQIDSIVQPFGRANVLHGSHDVSAVQLGSSAPGVRSGG
jgi:hypothetical protein